MRANVLLLVPLPVAASAFPSTPSNIVQPTKRKMFQLTAIFIKNAGISFQSQSNNVP